MSPNDENTRATVMAVSDQVDSLISHFQRADASWDDFTFAASELYLERLKLGLNQLAMCIQAELHRRIIEVPTELGI